MSGLWVDVCGLDRIIPDSGVCALVDGKQVAVFRLADDSVFAIGNHDPFSDANVLSRGLVGDVGGVPVAYSPIYKQAFDLQTGVCLSDDTVSVPSYAVRVEDGIVQVASVAMADAGAAQVA